MPRKKWSKAELLSDLEMAGIDISDLKKYPKDTLLDNFLKIAIWQQNAQKFDEIHLFAIDWDNVARYLDNKAIFLDFFDDLHKKARTKRKQNALS